MLMAYEKAILQRVRELYEPWRRSVPAIRSVERGARNGFTRDVHLGAAFAPSNSSMGLLFSTRTGGEDNRSRTTESLLPLRIRDHGSCRPGTRGKTHTQARAKTCSGVISGQQVRKRKHGTRAFSTAPPRRCSTHCETLGASLLVCEQHVNLQLASVNVTCQCQRSNTLATASIIT